VVRANRISRRDVLAMFAASGFVLTRHVDNLTAQVETRIDRYAKELDAIISVSEPIRELATGLGNDAGNAEGPVWWKEAGYLLFSDIGNDRRMKYAPGQGTSVVKEPANRANGLTRDGQGRLVAAEHETRQVARYDPNGSVTVIANRYQGKRLNRPNDVVVKSDGAIYFTDPFNRPPEPPEQWEQPVAGIYRVAPALGAITLLVDSFVFPNGLAFSPDEGVLYINDSMRRQIRAFDVMPNGLLAIGTERLVADLGGSEPGNPDGMKVDSAGNIYCGGSGGIYILDPNGKKLGRIVHGYPNTTNIGFGGNDWRTLYFTTRNTLGSVIIKIPGIPVPAVKRVQQSPSN
jgi:gluconolactonase